MTPLEGALIGLVGTFITTIGSVIIAYFSLRERLTRIEGQTNGTLTAAVNRADKTTDALLHIATTAAGVTPTEPPQSTPPTP